MVNAHYPPRKYHFLRSLTLPARHNSFLPLAHVEFQLPALLAVAAQAPQLQSPHFGDPGVDVDRHRAALLARSFQGGREGTQLVDLALPVVDQRAHRVAAPDGRAEETELGRLADDQAEL